MATPTAPTPALLVAEALLKAGYKSGSTEYGLLLTRGEQTWMEEIKYDIWSRAKKLRSFQTSGYKTISAGTSSYSMPSDFSSLIGMELLSGSATGTAQSGAATSITLSASDSLSESETQGLNIFITGGTGADQLKQITAYDNTTKIATVDSAWATNPDSTSTYLLVTLEQDLQISPIWDYSKKPYPTTKGTPFEAFIEGDDTVGAFKLYYTPDKTYGVRFRYYTDITLADTAAQVMTTIYRKYRMVFIQGIMFKALEYMDDDRAAGSAQTYNAFLANLVSREHYGTGLNSLQSTVIDRL